MCRECFLPQDGISKEKETACFVSSRTQSNSSRKQFVATNRGSPRILGAVGKGRRTPPKPCAQYTRTPTSLGVVGLYLIDGSIVTWGAALLALKTL